MEVDTIPARYAQNPLDVTLDTTADEADLGVRPDNLSSTTDIGDITRTGKLLTFLHVFQF